MRWDLDSRKLAYKKSEKQFQESQLSFEQELDNLKSILADDQTSKSNRTKKYIAIIVGLAVLVAILGVAFLYLL